MPGSRPWSTTLFAINIEAAPQPRLAAAIALLHLFAAISPWLAHCEPALAIALTLLALAGMPATLQRVPGRHCRLRALRWTADGCFVRLAGETGYRPAALARSSRAFAKLVHVDLVVEGRHLGWLLPGPAASPAAFRRLKSRIRLAW